MVLFLVLLSSMMPAVILHLHLSMKRVAGLWYDANFVAMDFGFGINLLLALEVLSLALDPSGRRVFQFIVSSSWNFSLIFFQWLLVLVICFVLSVHLLTIWLFHLFSISH